MREKASPLRVLFVTPECAPLAKTGGLGDVSAALPAALKQLRIDVRVLLPGYPEVLSGIPDSREIARLSSSAPPFEARLLEARLSTGVPLLALDCPVLYQRPGGPYQNEAGEDWLDNALRFGALSQAAAVLGSASSPLAWRPDIVHCNDWQAGLAPAYLHYTAGPHAASLMTVHNLAFHGSFPPETVAALGLPPASYAIEGLEFYGRMSFLKAGLIYADALSTVSPTYAREVQSEAHGGGMAGVMRMRSAALTGILNGIDTGVWNPATDPLIARRYGPGTLNYKRSNKEALLRRLDLPVAPDIALLGVVSRYTHQKGTDLLAAAVPELAGIPVHLAALGAGEREHEESLRLLAARYPGRVSVTYGFDERLAHLIEAGADMFVMPSRFEPCGLNQMYSQRYGTPPVAHATGGLADTIVDCTPQTLADGRATGFLFEEPTAAALSGTIRRAVAVFNDARSWRSLQRNAMARDFSWRESAAQYAAIYKRIARTRPLSGDAADTPAGQRV
ncbi:MAG TPA: glycogen synthase GlgA [Burkholderiales bacterium]|nr:glycogen synthase GlgA [Burkholderiales bacterium]